MSDEKVTHYAWLDLETTGLDKRRDCIIELAMVITDLSLNELDRLSLVVNPGPGLLKQRIAVMDAFVKNMHSENGLFEDLSFGPHVNPDQAQTIALARLRKYADPKQIMLAGSGVAQFDQPILEFQMPMLHEYFPYHPLDVGMIRRFLSYSVMEAEGNYLRDNFPQFKSRKHRALADVLDELEEARFFLKLLKDAGIVEAMRASDSNV